MAPSGASWATLGPILAYFGAVLPLPSPKGSTREAQERPRAAQEPPKAREAKRGPREANREPEML